MTYTDVIAMACEELGVPFSDYELIFENYIKDCMATFKSSTTLSHLEVDVEIEDGRGMLPAGVVKVDSVCGYSEMWDVQGRYIVLSGWLLAEYDEDTVHVHYRGWNTDENGDIVLPSEAFRRMLVAYIGWKHTRKFFERYSRDIREDYRIEFINTKRALL